MVQWAALSFATVQFDVKIRSQHACSPLALYTLTLPMYNVGKTLTIPVRVMQTKDNVRAEQRSKTRRRHRH